MEILAIVIFGLLVACNLAVFFGMPLKSMYNDFWANQKPIGKITANIFYAPAWVLKGLMYAAVIALYYLLWALYWLTMKLFSGLRFAYNRAIKFEL